MSAQRGGEEEDTRTKRLKSLIVTDSVHERFNGPKLHCAICKEGIAPNAIARHFDPTHPSKERCRYCGGKVFGYTLLTTDDIGNVLTKEEVYHSCRSTNAYDAVESSTSSEYKEKSTINIV